MSKTIVDDTLYEKVLSFLTSVIAKDPAVIDQLLKQGLFDHIKQAFDDKDQDYRVITLCLRLVGQMVRYGGSEIFSQMENSHRSFLTVITLGLRASEAALRCASLEACRYFVGCERGADWLLHNEHANTFISIALLDQSSYVVTEACKLFSFLLDFKILCHRMDPSKQIKQTLQQVQLEQGQLMSSLEFCWTIVNTRSDASLAYLRETELLYPLESLLYSNSRMVRARVIEILSVLLEYDPNPLTTLGKPTESNINPLDQCYHTLHQLAISMIENAREIDTLTTGVSIMECSFVLLKRRELPEACFHILLTLSDICLDNNKTNDKKYKTNTSELLNKSSRSKSLKKSLLQLLLRVIDALCQIYPDIVKDMKTIHLSLDVLSRSSLFSDQRVLKATLALLTTSLYSFVKLNMLDCIPDIVAKSINLLVDMLDKTALNCRSIGLVFESFNTLLSHDHIGILVAESSISNAFVDSLSLKFLDTEWDVRDATIEFVGLLFKQPLSKTKVSFALKYNLPLSVFHRIQDSEAYVRASALDVLQASNMMKTREGWDYIQQHKCSRELASTLPKLLYDSEAFVRRATLDAILCLVDNRSCQGMEMDAKSHDQQSLNSGIIRKLIDDQDPDVRIRACKLIESLWLLYQHEMHEQNKRTTHHIKSISFFHGIQPGPLLIQAVNDMQRLVRIEAVRVIENILEKAGRLHEQRGKRMVDIELNDEDTAFLDLLMTVDISQVKQTLDPEHLYEEAFDINADMMTHSIIPSNPEDDVNMLDCY
ncbi:hypothetical protein K501DRAFT_230121 [Backusella circina FSU 941]|nr:hypothetical protein K501DRAFT_230121 [Backusella circina FSU 941]